MVAQALNGELLGGEFLRHVAVLVGLVPGAQAEWPLQETSMRQDIASLLASMAAPIRTARPARILAGKGMVLKRTPSAVNRSSGASKWPHAAWPLRLLQRGGIDWEIAGDDPRSFPQRKRDARGS